MPPKPLPATDIRIRLEQGAVAQSQRGCEWIAALDQFVGRARGGVVTLAILDHGGMEVAKAGKGLALAERLQGVVYLGLTALGKPDPGQH